MRSELSNEWLQTLEENLNLLEEEKKTKLKGIILNMREELRNIWDRLYYGQVCDKSYFIGLKFFDIPVRVRRAALPGAYPAAGLPRFF